MLVKITLVLIKHMFIMDFSVSNRARFCFDWPLVDGFNGDSTSELTPDHSTWSLVHGLVMTIGWGVLVDFGILAIMYFRVKNHYIISHALLLILVSLMTLAMAILMIVRNRSSIFYNFELMAPTTRAHFILGVMIIVAVVC
jgi:hypothetical protein